MQKLKKQKISSQPTQPTKKRRIEDLDHLDDVDFWSVPKRLKDTQPQENVTQVEKKRKKIRIKRDTDEQILKEVKKEAKINSPTDLMTSLRGRQDLSGRKSDTIVDDNFDDWKPFEIRAAMAHVETSNSKVGPRNGKARGYNLKFT